MGIHSVKYQTRDWGKSWYPLYFSCCKLEDYHNPEHKDIERRLELEPKFEITFPNARYEYDQHTVSFEVVDHEVKIKQRGEQNVD